MVDQIDEERFQLKSETLEAFVPKNNQESESDFSSSDEDSIFQGEENQEKAMKFYLFDKKKNKDIQEGTKVRL